MVRIPISYRCRTCGEHYKKSERHDCAVASTDDLNLLTTIAKGMNSKICEDEGYDPVGVDWILSVLREAYVLGQRSAQ